MIMVLSISAISSFFSFSSRHNIDIKVARRSCKPEGLKVRIINSMLVVKFFGFARFRWQIQDPASYIGKRMQKGKRPPGQPAIDALLVDHLQ